MAESLWGKRYRVAAAVLLGGSALLALLDLAARSGSTSASAALTLIAIALALTAVVAAFIPWENIDNPWIRLLPAAVATIALVGAITVGGAASTRYAPVGLTVIAALILGFVGFVSAPGLSLGLSPVLLLTLLLAYWRESDRLSLALPLVAVPAGALAAEVVSALVDRVTRSGSQGDTRLQRLGQLEDVLRRFRQPGSLEQAAHQVAAAATEIFDVERATVVLRDTQGSLIPVSVGATTNNAPGPLASQLVAKAVTGDQPEFIPTETNGTMLVLPLPAAEAPAGAVLVYPIATTDPEFTLELARLFAVQIAIAIEHLFVIDELNRATTRDELTGIGNRRHAEALLRALQPGDALILLDLDGFKTINDTQGHPAGDLVLQALSRHLQETLRDSDTSARLGGDEFLIVARRAFADPLTVANRVLLGWEHQAHGTTLSAGVALHEADHPSEETFERADRALYRAKAKGKNQAQLWRPGLTVDDAAS
ncbi:MAG: sensor domain-containing diguanylate cyclase [Acidimicrobiales bacterium]